MSRDQEDYDNALRDALAIRSAYYDLLDLADRFDHQRFIEAEEYRDRFLSTLDYSKLVNLLDSMVGACVSSIYNSLNPQEEGD